ncbi:MAG TPA: DUF1080 domain-containing protein [Fibrobacteria bacterium]|nr:DUF1080 domain-containing protein [Fibrobacteria bacterium]
MAMKTWLATWLVAVAAFSARGVRAEDTAWVSLVKGQHLTGWTPYFQKLGLKNQDSTFKITPQGTLLVDINLDYNTSGFGHLFYTARKFSYYLVRAVYRFPSTGYGPNWKMNWNHQNNGLMIHSQDPATMKGKDFPNSIEVQLLGKLNEQNGELKSQGFKYATTANMCSPGSFVAFKDNNNYTEHCTAAQYPAAWKNTEIPWEDPAGWSDVTVRTLGDSLMQHYIHGVKVFEYSKLRLDNGQPLKDGYLSIQAEGTSTEFKSIEVLDLVGCMDSSKPAYRTYFVKHDPAACNNVSAADPVLAASPAYRVSSLSRGVRVEGEGSLSVSLVSLDGSVAATGTGIGEVGLAVAKPGIHWVRVAGPKGVRAFRIVLP